VGDLFGGLTSVAVLTNPANRRQVTLRTIMYFRNNLQLQTQRLREEAKQRLNLCNWEKEQDSGGGGGGAVEVDYLVHC